MTACIYLTRDPAEKHRSKGCGRGASCLNKPSPLLLTWVPKHNSKHKVSIIVIAVFASNRELLILMYTRKVLSVQKELNLTDTAPGVTAFPLGLNQHCTLRWITYSLCLFSSFCWCIKFASRFCELCDGNSWKELVD